MADDSDNSTKPRAPVAQADAITVRIEREPVRSIRYELPAEEPPIQRQYRMARQVVQDLDGERRRLEALKQPVPVSLIERLAEKAEEVRRIELDREASGQIDQFDALIRGGVIIKPYVDPIAADEAVLESDILTACVLSMGRNIGARGWEPIREISDAAYAELDDKTKTEVEKEKRNLGRFFQFCNYRVPFEELCRRRDVSMENTGYAAWELLRNGKREIATIETMWSWTFGIGQPSDYIVTPIPVRDEDGQWTTETTEMRWSLVVQSIQGRYRYFKQLGDPRTIDALTGAEARSEEEAAKLREERREAREVILFTLPGATDGITPYSAPRWLGATFSAKGRKAAAETNYLHFDNNCIPDLAVCVDGGEFKPGVEQKIQDHFRSNKGRHHRKDILILQAFPAGDVFADKTPPAVKIHFERLADIVQKEGNFLEYGRQAKDDVAMTFGIPPILRGAATDYTRATAGHSRQVAEQEVFQSERGLRDHIINRMLLSQPLAYVGGPVRWWSFKSKGPTIVDEEAIRGLIEVLMDRGGMSADEARAIAERHLGYPLAPYGKDWSRRPWPVNKGLADLGFDFTSEAQDLPGDGDKNPEADEADQQTERGLPRRIRVYRALVPRRELEAAMIGADGVLRLRDELRAEIRRRVAAERAAGGAAATS